MSGVLDPPGTRYVDRPKPGRPGVIERTFVDGGPSVYGGGPAPALIERQGARTFELALPKLRDGAPRFAVRLPAAVRDEIKRQIAGDFRFETGGWLFSIGLPGINSVSISRASGPGPSSRHWTHRVQLSRSEDVEAEFSEYDAGLGLRCVADWHLHPSGGALPSDGDMRGWAARLSSTIYRYVGVIATPDLPGSTTPLLRAWVTQRDGSGGLVCDPAEIIQTLD